MTPMQVELDDSAKVDVKLLSQAPGALGEEQALVTMGPLAVVASLPILKVLRDILNKLLKD